MYIFQGDRIVRRVGNNDRCLWDSNGKSLCITNLSRPGCDNIIFPDCGESSLRNFFNILLYDSEEKIFKASYLKNSKLKFHPRLIHYYQKHLRSKYTNSQQAYNDWAYVLYGLNQWAKKDSQITYLYPHHHPVCEIGPGGRNMLNVFKVLTGTDNIIDIVADISLVSHKPIFCDLSNFHPDRNDLPDFENKILISLEGATVGWYFLQRHFRFKEISV